MANQDIFGKPNFTQVYPVTADQVQLIWSGNSVMQATNVQIQYQQNVTRRYTLSSPQNQASIIPGRPIGTLTMGRLFVTAEQNLFKLPGWNVCQPPATIIIACHAANTGSCSVTSPVEYTLYGAYVTGYSFSANADDLQVIDNITVEFLQMNATGFTA